MEVYSKTHSQKHEDIAPKAASARGKQELGLGEETGRNLLSGEAARGLLALPAGGRRWEQVKFQYKMQLGECDGAEAVGWQSKTLGFITAL